MNSYHTCLKILLLTAGCLFASGLYAAEEAMEEDVMADEEGMEEEGMLEEEAEELPPLYTSEIELGVGFSTTNTFSAGEFKFGEYNGLEDDGAFAIGNIKLRKYSIIGDDDNNYWEFIGTNLGLDPRNIYAEFSHDGTYGEYNRDSAYRFYLEYDQIPHNQFEDGQTPFRGAGTTNQTLPGGWVGSSSVGGMTALDASLRNVELETERYRMGGGFEWHFSDHWSAQANYRHEIKEGSDPIGAIFGVSGGNPRGSILAVPINYDTDEFDINLAYAGDKAQYSLAYHLSLFDNNDDSVFFENPFENPFSRGSFQWAAGSGFSDGAVGQLSLFPDNQAHQVQFAGGYNFTPRTRATATVSYSRWLQDEDFLPYSNVHTPAVALPRNSLDGDIETIFANLNLYSRLTNKWDVRGRYTFEDRNNDTPRDIYLRMPNDSADGTSQDPLSSNARVNWTYDHTLHKVELDSGYRLMPMTKLDLGFAYENKDRNFSEVDDTDEYTGKIKLSASPFATSSGWIKYQYSTLDGSDYVSNEPFLAGHNPAFIQDEADTFCGGVIDENCAQLFENDYRLRKFYFSDRDRHHVQAAVSFYPHEKVDFTLNGEYRNDDFGNSELGLQESQNYNITLDVGFHPNDRVNTYAFATYENFQYDQRGYRRDGDVFGPTTPFPDDANEDFWTTDTEDHIYMVGTGFDWYVIEDKFKLNLDFTHSRSYTTFDQAVGPNIVPGNSNFPLQLPAVTTRLTNVSVTGEYQIRDNMKARLRYLFERFHSQDFGLDDVDPDTLSNVILMGQQSPSYSAHVFGISFVYEFQ